MTQPRAQIFTVIGNTPLVQITHRHVSPKVRILAKLEGSNPGGSVKDRTAHYETTGPEIYAQTEGLVDVFVAGLGTSGTLMGTGRYLREKKPGVKIVGIEPPVGHAIQGLKNMKEAIVPRIYRPEELSDVITVNDDEAYDTARALARHEGLFVGMSSGSAPVHIYCSNNTRGITVPRHEFLLNHSLIHLS